MTRLNPFPGLRPFEPDEDYLFFGREKQVDELLRRLRTTRFLAVLGTSGSGKSSLVRSGLIPSLHGGGMTRAGSSWRVAILRPGEDPIGHLAAALATALGAPESLFFETTLRASKLGLAECVRQAHLRERDNVLVLADQFEELFRFKQSGAGSGHGEAVAFVKLLIEASRCPDLPLYVAFTMRSDFLGNCMEFAELPEVVNEGLYLVPRMTRDELRSAITGPVAVGGAEISPRLVSRLLNDVGDNPDQLPILQHALMRTWDRWEQDQAPGEPLDLRHYEAIGTMGEALSQHAEEALGELDEDGRRIAEVLFKALTENGIRRPTTLGEIGQVAGAAEGAVIAVVDRFRLPGRSFLMPPAGTALHAGTMLDISHESLMRIWERLRDWVAEEAQSAQIYLGAARAALRHEEGAAALWRDPELQVALTWRQDKQPTAAWAQRYDPSFARAMRFLDASEAERRREIADREAHRLGEQRQKTLRRLAWGLSIVALVILGFGAYAFVMKGHAEQAKKKEEELRVFADTQRQLAVRQGQLADLRRHEAEEQKDIADGERAKAETQSQIAVDQKLLADEQRQRAEEQRLNALAKEKEAEANRLEADGQRKLAEQAKERADTLRDQAEASGAEAERMGHLALARSAALQVVRLPDDQKEQKELAALIALHAWRLHITNGGAVDDPVPFNALWAALVHLQPQPAWSDHLDAVRALAVDPHGTAFFSGSEDGKLRRFDISRPGSSGEVLATFPKGVRAVAVDPEGRFLAAGSADGSLRVLELGAPGPGRALTASGAPIVALAFQPQGTLLAAGRSDGDLSLWDLGSSASPPRRLGEGKVVTGLAFSPDGSKLAAGLGKAGAHLWDVRKSSEPPREECLPKDVRSVSFQGPGFLACGTSGGEIVLKKTGSQMHLLWFFGHRASVNSLSFSPDGGMLASGSSDHTVRLWNASWTVSEETTLEPIVLTGHPSWVWSVAFLPNGEQVLSGGADRTVRLWSIRSSRLAEILCGMVSRPLTAKEWGDAFSDKLAYDGSSPCSALKTHPKRTSNP